MSNTLFMLSAVILVGGVGIAYSFLLAAIWSEGTEATRMADEIKQRIARMRDGR